MLAEKETARGLLKTLCDRIMNPYIKWAWLDKTVEESVYLNETARGLMKRILLLKELC